MNKRRRNKINTQYIMTVVIFGIILISVLAGLVLTTNNTPNVDEEALSAIASQPTLAPTSIVFPTVEPGGPNLTPNTPIVNSIGLFQVAAPTDFTMERNEFNGSRATTTFLSYGDQRLAVIDVLLDLGINFESHQALSDEYLTLQFFKNAWLSYEEAIETSRTVGDTVIVNFDLISNGSRYLGRQISWLDGDWLHTVRLVVPGNNPALLDALEALVVPTFISFEDQRNVSPAWVAAADPDGEFLIRHPNWQVVNALTLQSRTFPAQIVMRTVAETPLESGEEALTYVRETLRPGAEAEFWHVLTREFGNGYIVSFKTVDRDGNPISGLVALLNDEENNLHIAELRLSEPDIDLLSLESDSPYNEMRAIIETFMVLPPAGYTITPAANIQVTEAPAATQEATSAETEEAPELPAEDRPVQDSTSEATAESN